MKPSFLLKLEGNFIQGMAMKTLLLGLLFSASAINFSYAQDLLKEKIWKLAPRKKSIFLDKGVFHSGVNPKMQKLVGIRNSYVPARGYERIVIDFSGINPPRIYGHVSKKDKKVYIDLFNTSMSPDLEGVRSIKYLKDVKFFDIEPDHISAELSFNKSVSFDIFYLENPARLVLDVKK